jgi:hypothetical protein
VVAGLRKRMNIGRNGWKGTARDADDRTCSAITPSVNNGRKDRIRHAARWLRTEGAQNPDERRRRFKRLGDKWTGSGCGLSYYPGICWTFLWKLYVM